MVRHRLWMIFGDFSHPISGFRTRLPGLVFGYLFSAPSERLEDYCKYQENDFIIKFVGGDVKISFVKIYSSVFDCAY
jgi:hypothetical protein